MPAFAQSIIIMEPDIVTTHGKLSGYDDKMACDYGDGITTAFETRARQYNFFKTFHLGRDCAKINLCAFW